MKPVFMMMIPMVLLLGCQAHAEGAPPLLLVQRIELSNVEGRIDHMCVSPDGRRLFIAALGNNSVERVDVESGIRDDAIGNIKEPQGVAYIPESNKLAVASGQGDQCLIYDQAMARMGTIDGLRDADNVRYDPQAKLLYVGYGSGAIAVIDPDKAAKIADIKLDGHPESFQLETRGPRIFVNVPTAQQIAVIDREKRSVVATWPVREARANFPMALDENHHRLFVACREPARMLVVDTESGKTIDTLDCAGDADDVFYDGPSKRIYVSGGAGSISVFEQSAADHYRPLASVPTAPGARTSLLAPQTGKLYVAVPHRGEQKAQIRVFHAPAPGQ